MIMLEKYVLKPCQGSGFLSIPNTHIYVVKSAERRMGYVLPSDVDKVFRGLDHEVSQSHATCDVCIGIPAEQGDGGRMLEHILRNRFSLPKLAEGQKLVLMPCHGFLNVGIPIGHVYKVELDGKLVGYLPKNKLLKVGFNINQFGISSSNCSCLVCVPDDQVNGDVKKVEIVLIKTQDDLKDLTDRL